MPLHTVFYPTLSVSEEGKVSFDFGDSFDATYDENGNQVDGDISQQHVDLIDEILGVSTTPSERLRNLADFLDTQEGTTPWENDHVQFARLICEINATQDNLDLEAISESTGLDLADIDALFDRADDAWERAKGNR
jgi:hypothetical protein